ncbi:hypothetical protein GCM10009616_35800 [Microlunatus lacustris]
MDDLATLPDLELAWRTLTSDEKPRAAYKLGQASRYVRRHFPDIDARIGSGQLAAEDASDVVVAMVERAFPIRTGIQSETETRGPWTETVRYFDAKSGMYLTEHEEAVLAPPNSSSTSGAFSTRPGFARDLDVPC